MLRSVDSVSEEDGMHHAYPAEFLQQLTVEKGSDLKSSCF